MVSATGASAGTKSVNGNEDGGASEPAPPKTGIATWALSDWPDAGTNATRPVSWIFASFIVTR